MAVLAYSPQLLVLLHIMLAVVVVLLSEIQIQPEPAG
jgi:hypothetical protein